MTDVLADPIAKAIECHGGNVRAGVPVDRC
jgi:hypothetical protein